MDEASAATESLDGVGSPRELGANTAPRTPRRRGWRGGLALPLHQVRRALREPARLRRVHYSSVLASLRSVLEPDERAFACGYFGIDAAQFRRLESDLLDDTAFTRSIEASHRDVRGRAIRLLGDVHGEDHDRLYRLLYYATRLERPRIVVETGVFDGFSSAFILKALSDNGHGRLCSIDLPARAATRASTDKMAFDALPPGCEPGWLVPRGLRDRWSLRLGTSRSVLAPWLAELAPIDLFFHDSQHTYANMSWEYGTAWPALAEGGLLLSDDVFWSSAFRRFSRTVGARGRIVRGVGFLRKGARLPR